MDKAGLPICHKMGGEALRGPCDFSPGTGMELFSHICTGLVELDRHCDAPDDDAEHTVFWCPYWTKLSESLGMDVKNVLCGLGWDQNQPCWGVADARTPRDFLDMVEAIMDKEIEAISGKET